MKKKMNGVNKVIRGVVIRDEDQFGAWHAIVGFNIVKLQKSQEFTLTGLVKLDVTSLGGRMHNG